MKIKLPTHIGIIIDGNRRWAKKKGLASWQGHEAGYQNLKKIARHAFKAGVKILTIYAFSTENWKRSNTEVSYLLKLIRLLVSKELRELEKDGIQLNILGDISKFDSSLQKKLAAAQKITSKNKHGILNVCLNYGGRQEILAAIKKLITAKIPAHRINETLLSQHLNTAGQADPDLIIRTSGEQRLSGFLTWQGVYSELYFSPKMWPDFSTADFDRALDDYLARQRRFGR